MIKSVLLAILISLVSAGVSAGQDSNVGATILDVTADLESFSLALNETGLDNTLDNRDVIVLDNGSFAVFAPSVAAFQSLSQQGVLEGLLASPDEMKRVLSYHAVWLASGDNLTDLGSVRTLQGGNLTIAENGMTVNGARVSETRDYASGTVYVIDQVLIPTAGENGVVEASERLGLSEFISSIESAGFINRLDGQGLPGIEGFGGIQELAEGPFTIFAPTDAAFDAAEDTTESITSDEKSLRTLLSYHVVSRADLASGGVENATSATSVKTLDGSSLVIDRSEGTVNGANITGSQRYDNGIIYSIDQVLIPVRLSMPAA